MLRPAHDTIKQHRYFQRKLRWVSDKKHLNAEVASTKTALEQQINNSFDELRRQAVEDVNRATGVHRVYQRDRTTGGKKIGRAAQDFVRHFADFLNVYSGIVELLKGAGDIYGSVAYETLSIFFIVRFLMESVS